MIVKKLPWNTRAAHSANIGGKNFSLEFRVEQIPVGLELARIDQLRVISCARAGRNVTLVNENMLALFIGVLMLALPPFRRIGDLGQNQGRLDRIEHLAEMKNLKQRISAAVVNVDEILAGPPLRNNALGEVGAGAGDVSDLDLGISFLKHTGIDNRAVSADRDRDLSFLLGGANRSVPFGLPGCFRFGGKNESGRANELANYQENAEDDFHRVNSPPVEEINHKVHKAHKQLA